MEIMAAGFLMAGSSSNNCWGQNITLCK